MDSTQNIAVLGEILILLRKAESFSEQTAPGQREGLGMVLVSRCVGGEVALYVTALTVLLCLFSSQVITFPARRSRRGRVGKVVTFCRKFTATSPGFTPSLRRTAPSQVGRDITALGAFCKKVKGTDVSVSHRVS